MSPQCSSGRANWLFLGFLAVTGYLRLTEHQAHASPYLPLLLVPACPLMHLFMHGGHEQGNRDEHGSHGGACGHQHSDHHAGHAPEPGRQPDDAT